MVEELSAFLSSCPYLRREGALFIDHTPETPVRYTLQIVPGGDVARRYVDGGGLRQVTFLFRSVEFTDALDAGNLVFYERLADWLRQARPEKFAYIEVLTCGYLAETPGSLDRGTYQIQARAYY